MTLHLQLFWTFFKISLFSIGGGYNMVPLMQHEVASRGWLSSERFMDVLAISEITPGPVAVNLATFTGYQVAGIPGAAVATAGVCLPGGVLLLALGIFAVRLRERPAFRAAMRGLMPALVGLLAATAIRLAWALIPADAALPPPKTCGVFAAALVLVLWKNPHPAWLMFAAAAAGLLLALA